MLETCKSFSSFCKVIVFITEKQIDLHQEQLCLICDVQTRWNSAYYMAKRIILMQQPLSVTLCAIRKGDLIPNDSEFAVLEQFIETMKPIWGET